MTTLPMLLNRRRALVLMASGTAMLASGAGADPLPNIVVSYDPTCGCCHKWIQHVIANGFRVTENSVTSHKAMKAQLGVPPELAACHTGLIDGYVIEGHVPAAAIKRLLAEKPEGRGLAVPGMPVGSPGMEGEEPEVYDVILFGDGKQETFGRYREDKPV